MQVLRGFSAEERGLAQEVRGVNDQGLAFPMPPQGAHPLAQMAVRTAIHRNDPRVVNHLVEDHDVLLRLEQLDILVVRCRGHRWPRIESQDAPNLEASRTKIVDPTPGCGLVPSDSTP